MSILDKNENTKFCIVVKNAMHHLLKEDDEKDVLLPLYDYDNPNINFAFARLHLDINCWIQLCTERLDKKNYYILSEMRHDIRFYQKCLRQLANFFKKTSATLKIESSYEKLIEHVNSLLDRDEKESSMLPEDFKIFEPVYDAPIFTLIKKYDFSAVKHLWFGAAISKPDVIIKDVLEGNLTVLNNDDVLVYDDEIGDSLTYRDFTIWWNKNKNKYKWYRPENQLNEIELKVQAYYKSHYGNDENNPVLIPQVYLHYDPKDKYLRSHCKSNTALKFQRMDFLILYKGKRIIVEIDGKTHTEEHNLEEYSRQCEYDRTMRFLGYDVFRLGGYELTYNFDNTVEHFFSNLFEYLNK